MGGKICTSRPAGYECHILLMQLRCKSALLIFFLGPCVADGMCMPLCEDWEVCKFLESLKNDCASKVC